MGWLVKNISSESAEFYRRDVEMVEVEPGGMVDVTPSDGIKNIRMDPETWARVFPGDPEYVPAAERE